MVIVDAIILFSSADIFVTIIASENHAVLEAKQ